MTAGGAGFLFDGNVLELVVMVAQLCGIHENH